ncbi:hypothetical protein PENTCL1PPCAC_17750 [Pristionchus entomophagus]|uniref:Transcription factor CBF/NF-Y/archaeal histone domain-containing protein n=1 Tax=Pristionchus entomophagus TaxID=358040 RepID=A0AAV5TMG3_9BILA|nr:hypothetical protein PENTCL1PPCAC_17750 [Pristionchus entomophagus]
MSESPQGERDRSESVVEEDKEEENEIDEVERQSEGSGGIHDELIDAIARGTEDQEVLREQDRYLPICNIARVMRRMVPESGKMSKESKEAIQEAVSEFISFITSEASDKCIEEQRKTITCDDLLNAIEVMGFEKYVEPLKLFMTRYREATRADRPPGEGGDTRTPSPPSPPISTPLLIPTPAPFPSSLASGPGGPIQPAPSLSSTTALFNTGTGPMRISLPPGYSIGEKEMFKGLSKQRSLNGQEMNPPPSGSSGMGGEEEMEMGVNGHPHQLISIHPKQGSSESPITIFVDQNTGQKYRNVVGQDGTQRLAPIRSNQNIKVIRRPHPSSSTLPIDSPQAHPIGPSSSSSISDHQSPLISSTTTTPQFPSQSHYHPQVTTHLSYSGQNHSHPSHHSQYHPVSFHDSSSSSIHSSMPPPSSSSSLHFIH